MRRLIQVLAIIGCAALLIFVLPKAEESQDTGLTNYRVGDYYSHYAPYVYAPVDIKTYKIVDGEYVEAGWVYANANVPLDIFKKSDYFKIKDMPYYVKYDEVFRNYDYEYIPKYRDFQNFIPFNENIVLKPNAVIHVNDVPYMILGESTTVPIIVKEDDAYYFEFYGKVGSVSSNDVESIVKANNSEQAVATDIPVFMYHNFFSSDLGETGGNSNWIEINQFEDHVKYLSENNYVTLFMNEIDLFMDGKVQLPVNSVAITIDDAHESVKRLAYPVLEKYNENATSFVITSLYSQDIIDGLWSYNVELHSHSDNMHRGGCSEGHGGLFQCIDTDEGVADLKLSSEKLRGSTTFCYPFGDYNDSTVEMLEAAGYKLAFTTEPGRINQTQNKLTLPRVRIFDSTDLNSFINLLQ